MSGSRWASNVGNVAHARRPEPLGAAKERRDLLPDFFVRRREPDFVAGQPHPGAVQRNLLAPHKALKNREKCRRRQARLKLQAQPLETDAGEIGIVGVKALQRRQQAALELQPDRRRQREHALARRCLDDAEAFANGLHLRFGQRAVARERGEIDVMRRDVEQSRERALRVADHMRLQLREPLRRAPFARRRAQIEKFSAADGALRGGVAQHEAIACRRRDRPLEHDLHQRFAAGRDRCVAEQHDAGADFGRGMMQARRHPLRHRLLFGGEQSQAGVDAVGRRMQVGIEHDLAAGNRVLADAVAGQIERAALSGDAVLGRPVLRVERAHPRDQTRWADRHAISRSDCARQHGAGHHGAGAGQRERTIDREPETLRRCARPDGVRRVEQSFAQCVDAVAGQGRDRDDLGAFQAGALQELRDVGQNLRSAAAARRDRSW